MGIPIFAKGIEIAIPTKEELKKAFKKSFVKPTFITTIKNAIGTDINIAAMQEKTIPLYFFLILI